MKNALLFTGRLGAVILVASLATGVTLSSTTAQMLPELKVDPKTVYHVVNIKDFAFFPATTEINAGDVVTWTNHDIVPHTATAADGSWDSGLLVKGASFSLIVEKGIVLDYYCFYHPMMTGKLAVKH